MPVNNLFTASKTLITLNNLLAAAYNYIDNGICVIATGKEKNAVEEWKPYEQRMITRNECAKMFGLPYTKYLAVVCGQVSGNLEVIDIDCKYDLTGHLFENYMQAITDNDPELASSLLVISTMSGGYHLYYRCSEIEGNQPDLARRYATEAELAADPKAKVRVLIETRGQGGYVLAPPSAGYSIKGGNKIPTITPEQRQMLFAIARTFNEVIQEKKDFTVKPSEGKGFFTTPWDDFNNSDKGMEYVLQLLDANGWKEDAKNRKGERLRFTRPGKHKGISADYHTGLKRFYVFTSSSEFEAGHGYTNYGIVKLLLFRNDSRETTKWLIGEGYGEKRGFGDKVKKQLYQKKSDGQSKEDLVKFLVDKHKKTEVEAGEIVDKLEKIWGERVCTFWEIKEPGKAVINRSALIEFLYKTGGFALYYYDSGSTIYKTVQCRNGFIEDVSSEHIKKFLLTYIDTLPEAFDDGLTPDDIKEMVLKGAETFFSRGLMEFLGRGNYDFLKDTATHAFFPFRNGVVVVTKETIELKTYEQIGKVIWKSQVINFDISITPDLDYTDSEYFRFIRCISKEEPDRWDFALTLIGYLLHTYKDPTKAFAVILAEETENEKEGGGTGKGIFFKAISRVINTVVIDGKTFKPDKSFAFQRVGLDTKLVVFEDVKKNFDFEGCYPMITEGMTTEKKNKDELFIDYKDSPKIGITTNYNVNTTGNHGKRRQKVFELFNFFKPGNTPEDYFKHKLFDDWDEAEWGLFYNLMFICVQCYMQDGIKEVVNSEKLKRKQIRLNYGEDFLEWLDVFTHPETGSFCKPAMLQSLWRDYLNDYGLADKDYSLKRFKSALVSGIETFDFRYRIRKNPKAGGGREFTLFRNDEEKQKNIPENGTDTGFKNGVGMHKDLFTNA